MKLLNRQEIESKRNSERQTLIDEGLKLAKKVDVLRETAAKEEENLAKFREGSLAQLREDIQKLIDIKNALEASVASLKEEKEVMFKEVERREQAVTIRERENRLQERKLKEMLEQLKLLG